MQYLVSALKGEAYDVISSLEASAENFREAWQMLIERYDDQGLIIGKHVKALFDLPIMSKNNHTEEAAGHRLETHASSQSIKKTEHWDDLMLHLVTTSWKKHSRIGNNL